MASRHIRKTVGVFEIHTLPNDAISLSMAPALGGRIVSLEDRVSRDSAAVCGLAACLPRGLGMDFCHQDVFGHIAMSLLGS